MKWTTDRPTEPGVYWVIDPQAGAVEPADADIVRLVVERDGVLWVREIGRDVDFRMRLDSEYSRNTRWYGPITPPTD